MENFHCQNTNKCIDDIIWTISGGKTLNMNQLKGFLYMTGADFETKPPTDQQVELIFTILKKGEG